MNELITKKQVTMSSQEISELLGSRHDKVKQSIERLANRGAIQLPPLGGVKNHLGQNVEVYTFSGEKGKRDSIIVVAQLSPEFTAKIVDRWIELETGGFKIPQTYAEALQLAANQAKQLEEQKPKVEYFDLVSKNETHLNATQVGQKVGLSAFALNKHLEDLGVYNRAIKRGRVFSQEFIDKGFGMVKTTSNGFTQAVFTMKGEQEVIRLLTSEGII